MGPPHGRRHRFTLRFEDAALERAFLEARAPRMRRFSTLALINSGVAWAAAYALMPTVARAELVPAARQIILFTVGPCVVFGLLAARRLRSAWALQVLGGVLNGLAAIIALWVVRVIGDFDRYAVPALMVTTIFAFVQFGMFFVTAAITTLTYAAIYVVMASQTPSPTFVFDVFLLASAILPTALATYIIESATRDAFVAEHALAREMARADALLLNVLPAPVAAQLKERQAAIAERFDEATVIFADIVGFTPLSARMEPDAVVAMLDGLFSRFDDLAERHGVEKIKTIGDAYMGVAGAPQRRPDHAAAVVALGLDLLAAVEEWAKEEDMPITLRVGIHSGPIVAGVIGKKKFIYDLWGDTVNTASRAESHGVPGAVHVTDATWQRVRHAFVGEERGEIEMKGKGRVRTVLVRGRAA
jgi:class 3 adenylate cyclase